MSSTPDRDAGGARGPVAAPGSVLLLGHGSHLDGESSRPVYALAQALRRRKAFREVRVAFWKEDPHLHHALQTVEHREVFAVPIFTSTGYFTEHVVPRELGLTSRSCMVDGIRVHYCTPVGTHPRMSDIVLERAHGAGAPGPVRARRGAGERVPETDVDLVVVGHGTGRHPESGRVVRELVAELAGRWPGGRVWDAFLDESPLVEELLDEVEADRVVVVPFFISEGWHAGVTLPRDLGIEGRRTQLDRKTVWYTDPVGSHPALADLVVEIVQAAVRERRQVTEETDPTPTAATLARAAFLRWIHDAGPGGRVFLETRVVRTAEEAYEIRHVKDVEAAEHSLEEGGGPEEASEIASRTDQGRHRPLKTAPTLRRGWRLSGLSADEVWEAYALLYPAAAVHWHLHRSGALPRVPYREAADRQTGMFARVGELPDGAVTGIVEDCCRDDRCLRRPAWSLSPDSGPVLPGGGGPSATEGPTPTFGVSPEVPCPEPCSVFFTRARDAQASLERSTGPGSRPQSCPP